MMPAQERQITELPVQEIAPLSARSLASAELDEMTTSCFEYIYALHTLCLCLSLTRGLVLPFCG